ncbi:MAG: glycosyltransferase family 2 protein [Pseudomonadota bacterium]
MLEPPNQTKRFAPLAPELSVIVPTFNERDNIEVLFCELDTVLAGIAWEAIFVDDDSPDGTVQAVRALGARDPRARCIRRIGRRGLAGACIEGMLAAQAPIVAVIDGDLQHDARILRSMLDQVGQGADLVVASRYGDGGNSDAFDWRRGWISRSATNLARRLPGVATTDPMSGFFMIRRDHVEWLAPHLSRHGFKILLDILATAHGRLRVVDVPFRFGTRKLGESKLDRRIILEFFTLVASKWMGWTVSPRFVSFAFVGGTGLGLHLLVLKAGLASGLAFAPAQSIATVSAMTTNFALNNALTYRDRRLHGWRVLPALARFYAICGAGALANVGVANWGFTAGSRWWVAGVTGSLVGAVWNYAMRTLFVWGATE